MKLVPLPSGITDEVLFTSISLSAERNRNVSLKRSTPARTRTGQTPFTIILFCVIDV